MMTVTKPALLATFLLLSLSLAAQRSGRTKDPTLNKGEGLEMTRSDLDKMRNQNQNKNARQVDVYMFAASFSILDSVLYVSDIQKVNDVVVNNRWFIKQRSEYESQFTTHIGAGDEESLLTSLYYSEKLKKITKRRSALIKRNARKNRFLLINVQGFSFSKPSLLDSSD
jgi:hypothetical protein